MENCSSLSRKSLLKLKSDSREGNLSTVTTPRLLLANEVAAVLRCTPRRVRQLTADGVLNPIRLSPQGHLRFRAEDIERLIAGEERPHE
jgi:Helix-turn-helix domain